MTQVVNQDICIVQLGSHWRLDQLATCISDYLSPTFACCLQTGCEWLAGMNAFSSMEIMKLCKGMTFVWNILSWFRSTLSMFLVIYICDSFTQAAVCSGVSDIWDWNTGTSCASLPSSQFTPWMWWCLALSPARCVYIQNFWSLTPGPGAHQTLLSKHLMWTHQW